MRLTFIGVESVSGNKFHKRHWSVYSKHKQQWRGRLMVAYEQCGEPHLDRKMRVVFTVYRKRLLDDDNLRSGLKAARDCLIIAGFIKDDSPKWGVFDYHQFTLKESPYDGHPAVVIEISPL